LKFAASVPDALSLNRRAARRRPRDDGWWRAKSTILPKFILFQ